MQDALSLSNNSSSTKGKLVSAYTIKYPSKKFVFYVSAFYIWMNQTGIDPPSISVKLIANL